MEEMKLNKYEAGLILNAADSYPFDAHDLAKLFVRVNRVHDVFLCIVQTATDSDVSLDRGYAMYNDVFCNAAAL